MRESFRIPSAVSKRACYALIERLQQELHKVDILDIFCLYDARQNLSCQESVCDMRPQPIRLKELREARGLTQEELADLMGVVPRQYQRYERGEGEPKLAGWIFLADFYDVSLDYLVGRSEEPARR